MRVELEITGPDGEQMVTPYGSVYYDGEGQAWVYTNPEPLVYVREPIEVERIVGDAPRDYFVAPSWCLDKPDVLRAVEHEFTRRDAYQGRCHASNASTSSPSRVD